MVRTYKLEADGSLKLPPDALDALGAMPGDEVKLFVDSRKKSVRIERHSDDPWADAMRQKQSKGLEDLLADQQKRQQAADDLFNQGLRKAKDED